MCSKGQQVEWKLTRCLNMAGVVMYGHRWSVVLEQQPHAMVGKLHAPILTASRAVVLATDQQLIERRYNLVAIANIDRCA